MKRKIYWLIIFYFVTSGGYLFFSRQNVNFHFMTPWERLITTVPVFVIPYLFATILFLILPIIFLIYAKKELFYSYTLTQIVASLISYAIFWIFPTSVIRESIVGNDIFTSILRQVHSIDRPSAAFPSSHVFQSIIIAYFLWIYFPKTRIYILIILPLIIVSTVLIKQHYLPDIFGGVIVAIAAIYFGKCLIKKLLPWTV